MTRKSARLILIGVVAMLLFPLATTNAGAANAPRQDLPTDLPTDDLPTDVLPSDEPSDDPSEDPDDPLPTDLPTDVLPTDEPTDVPTDTPTDVPTEVPGLEFESSVTIAYAKSRFKGKVSSPEALCVPDRTVVVKRVRNETARTIGRATTNDEGAWRLKKTTKKPGRYLARVKPATLEIGTCLGARSEKSVRLPVRK